MKDTKELLEILLQQVRDSAWDDFYGMCCEISRLWGDGQITTLEDVELCKYLKDNRPPELTDTYWWEQGEKEPRIDWLNKQIEKL